MESSIKKLVRKLLLGISVFLLIILNNDAEAQSDIQISLKLSPTITFNRFESLTDTLTIEKLRDDTRATFGLVMDFGFAESYYFSTGLLYSIRKVSFYAIVPPQQMESEQYQLEYLEIPVTLKLYTDNIGVDSKIYFQPGFTFDILTNWKGIGATDNRINDFKFFDSSFYVGAGWDKQFAKTNSFFVGLFYQRGLVNVLNDNPEVTLKNDLLGLDLGVRF